MRRVRNATRAHQSPTPAVAQVEAPLDDGTLALSLIQALIPLGVIPPEKRGRQKWNILVH